MKKMRVLLADDHNMFREGVRLLLESHPEIEVVGEAATGREAVSQARLLQPDLVLMDITMPDMSGLEATQQIKQDCPQTQILALTIHDNHDYFFRMLLAGASGYVLKEATSAELVCALTAVYQGGVYLQPSLAKKLVGDYLQRVKSGAEVASYNGLTGRERQVLELIATGYTSQDIADQLAVSINTVHSHRAHIMEKLGLHNRAELMKYALKEGLVSMSP